MRNLNRWIGNGRLTADPDTKFTEGDKPMCISKFDLAVGRKYDKDKADFISCVAFGKIGESVDKYLKKGTKVDIEGHIQTGSYTNKDGVKVYTTDVVVDDWGFSESKSSQNAQAGQPAQRQSSNSAPAQPSGGESIDGFMNIPDGIGEELPFA